MNSVVCIKLYITFCTSARESIRDQWLFKNSKPHPGTTNKMYLRYFLNEKGERQYTLATLDPTGKPTLSAHPARFSPEDKYSRQRIIIKKRFGLLITQQPEPIH